MELKHLLGMKFRMGTILILECMDNLHVTRGLGWLAHGLKLQSQGQSRCLLDKWAELSVLAMFPRSYTSYIIHIWSPTTSSSKRASWVLNKHAKEKGSMNEESSMLSWMTCLLAYHHESCTENALQYPYRPGRFRYVQQSICSSSAFLSTVRVAPIICTPRHKAK